MHVYRQRSQLLFLESLSSTLGGLQLPKTDDLWCLHGPHPTNIFFSSSFSFLLPDVTVTGNSWNFQSTHTRDLHRPFIVTTSNDLVLRARSGAAFHSLCALWYVAIPSSPEDQARADVGLVHGSSKSSSIYVLWTDPVPFSIHLCILGFLSL